LAESTWNPYFYDDNESTKCHKLHDLVLCLGPQQGRAPRKHFSWTSPGPVAFVNLTSLDFTKSPHIKVLLVNKL